MEQKSFSDLRTALEVAPETSVADLLARLMDTGVVVDAHLVLGLAQVDLIYISLRAVIANVDRLADLSSDSEARYVADD